MTCWPILMSAGTLGQFVLYTQQFLRGLVGSGWRTGANPAGATERLVEILDEQPGGLQPVAMPAPPRGEDRVRFRALLYRRDRMRRHRGELYGGRTLSTRPSGAEQAIFMRYYDPQSGRILIDGVALPDMTRGFRAHLSRPCRGMALPLAMPRKHHYGRPGATDEIMAKARPRMFIMLSKQNIFYEVGERGVTLSGVAPAYPYRRAILRAAPILL